jgi:predicted acetyltransferase
MTKVQASKRGTTAKNGIHRIIGKQLEEFSDILIDAYPGIRVESPDGRRRVIQNQRLRAKDRRITTWGLYRRGRIVGGLRLFDYTMNLFGSRIPVGGGGSLAVRLEHKKEHVARDLMTFFVEHYRQKGAPLAILYPFRPDFYRAMGFGYGPKLHQYRFRPGTLPDTPDRKHVRLLTKADLPALRRCYQRQYERVSGMIEETAFGWELIFGYRKQRYAGYFKGNELLGYVAFKFEPSAPDDFLRNDICISECIYNDREALAGLLSFLRSQHDQIDHIIINTLDDNFHFLPTDPRYREHLVAPVYHETNLSGVGLMFKVIDVPAMFAALAGHSFGDQSATVAITVTDSFTPANQGRHIVRFTGGKPAVVRRAKADVDISMDIAEFSSLLIGAINFTELYKYNLAEISDTTWLDRVNGIFLTDGKPVCVTQF